MSSTQSIERVPYCAHRRIRTPRLEAGAAMTDDLRLHGALIGRAARDRLATPALVIDRDALDRNLARMAEFARAHGIALRPHAKTHKSVDLARRQIAAGAIRRVLAPSSARPRRSPTVASRGC